MIEGKREIDREKEREFTNTLAHHKENQLTETMLGMLKRSKCHG